MSIFEEATRKQLRFGSPVGELTVEQLWELPLTGKTEGRPNLDSIARAVNRVLKDLTEESFVTPKPDPRKASLQLQLDILKRVIEVKLADKAAAEQAAANAERKRKLLAALSRQDEKQLEGMTKEQLEAEIAKLSG